MTGTSPGIWSMLWPADAIRLCDEGLAHGYDRRRSLLAAAPDGITPASKDSAI